VTGQEVLQLEWVSAPLSNMHVHLKSEIETVCETESLKGFVDICLT